MNDGMAHTLELAVGVVLVALGVEVFWRMLRRRGRFHMHAWRERSSTTHSHADAYAPYKDETRGRSRLRGLHLRALLVGLAHGAAGSAALLALAVTAAQDAWTVVVYVLTFGAGSIAGMAALSYAAA